MTDAILSCNIPMQSPMQSKTNISNNNDNQSNQDYKTNQANQTRECIICKQTKNLTEYYHNTTHAFNKNYKYPRNKCKSCDNSLRATSYVAVPKMQSKKKSIVERMLNEDKLNELHVDLERNVETKKCIAIKYGLPERSLYWYYKTRVKQE